MSIATEKQVRMAAQMYQMRDHARRVLGDKYAAKMAEFGRILKMTADRDGKSVLQVATEVCKKAGATETILIMAAVVELTEPSPALDSGSTISGRGG